MAVGADLASTPTLLHDVPDKDVVASYDKLVGSHHYGYAKQVLRYLKGVCKDLKLKWCVQTVKAPFADASLGGGGQ